MRRTKVKQADYNSVKSEEDEEVRPPDLRVQLW